VAFLATVLVDGALTGVLYTLIALSFVVVYRASRMINFALGEWTMLAARLTGVAAQAGLGLLGGVLGAGLAMIALGVTLSHVVLRRMLGQPLIALIMVTLGLGALVRGATSLTLASLPAVLRLPLPTEPLLLQGVIVAPDKLVAAVIAGCVVAAATAYFRWSRTGVALRAIADDQQVALAMGIDVERHFAITWSLVGVLSVLGGVLWAVTAGTGFSLVLVGLKVFPIVILGGLDSIVGTIVAALLLGVLEGLAASYLDPHVGGGFSTIVSYLVLIAVLFVRPTGLFGHTEVARV
jgi:branched-chain amino acid transport system permease protein